MCRNSTGYARIWPNVPNAARCVVLARLLLSSGRTLRLSGCARIWQKCAIICQDVPGSDLMCQMGLGAWSWGAAEYYSISCPFGNPGPKNVPCVWQFHAIEGTHNQCPHARPHVCMERLLGIWTDRFADDFSSNSAFVHWECSSILSNNNTIDRVPVPFVHWKCSSIHSSGILLTDFQSPLCTENVHQFIVILILFTEFQSMDYVCSSIRPSINVCVIHYFSCGRVHVPHHVLPLSWCFDH